MEPWVGDCLADAARWVHNAYVRYEAQGGKGGCLLQRNRLYGDLAFLWPLISPPEDHADEARLWRDVLRSKLGPGKHEILELGVGGGHNLSHLAGEFQATGIDSSQEMLDLSAKLNPNICHHLGDMRSVRLGRTFKAVLVHDAISYMLTADDLRSTFSTARAHLEPGGALVVAPEWFSETFIGTSVLHWNRKKGDMEITVIEYLHDPDPADSTIESVFFYILKERGSLRIEQDRHVTGLFPEATWLELMKEAGFVVEKHSYPPHDGGYGGCLLVGVSM